MIATPPPAFCSWKVTPDHSKPIDGGRTLLAVWAIASTACPELKPGPASPVTVAAA